MLFNTICLSLPAPPPISFHLSTSYLLFNKICTVDFSTWSCLHLSSASHLLQWDHNRYQRVHLHFQLSHYAFHTSGYIFKGSHSLRLSCPLPLFLAFGESVLSCPSPKIKLTEHQGPYTGGKVHFPYPFLHRLIISADDLLEGLEGKDCPSHLQTLLCTCDGCCCTTNLNLQLIILLFITLLLSSQKTPESTLDDLSNEFQINQ